MNEIHSTCIIDDNVEIGDGNIFLPYTIINGPTKIGNNNIIGPHSIIGSPGQDTRNPRYDSTNSYIEIGNNNIIREFTAIQKPCYREITKLGCNIFLMQSVHIPHDAVLQDNVVITPMCTLAGITTILKGATIGMNSSIHQHSIIGHYSMIAMGSAVNKNVRPFTIYIDRKRPRVNLYALTKYDLLNYKDEISAYVQDGKLPKSDDIIKYVDEFERLHAESKRVLYTQ